MQQGHSRRYTIGLRGQGVLICVSGLFDRLINGFSSELPLLYAHGDFPRLVQRSRTISVIQTSKRDILYSPFSLNTHILLLLLLLLFLIPSSCNMYQSPFIISFCLTNPMPQYFLHSVSLSALSHEPAAGISAVVAAAAVVCNASYILYHVAISFLVMKSLVIIWMLQWVTNSVNKKSFPCLCFSWF